jgi:hypothetical protein
MALFRINSENTFTKKIFMLTDGEADDRSKVIELSKEAPANCAIHTFGIGYDCSWSLVEEVAKNGRGSAYLVKDSTSNLRPVVIKALSRSMTPYLKKCHLSFSD